MLLFKGFFVSLQSIRGLVSSNNFYYCRYDGQLKKEPLLASKL